MTEGNFARCNSALQLRGLSFVSNLTNSLKFQEGRDPILSADGSWNEPEETIITDSQHFETECFLIHLPSVGSKYIWKTRKMSV